MTNEQYIEAIEKRHSRRAYKPKHLPQEIKDVIKQIDTDNKKIIIHLIDGLI